MIVIFWYLGSHWQLGCASPVLTTTGLVSGIHLIIMAMITVPILMFVVLLTWYGNSSFRLCSKCRISTTKLTLSQPTWAKNLPVVATIHIHHYN